MQWSSDGFSEQETCTALKFFTPDDVTEARCSALGKYLQEIPPPHTVEAYCSYYDQISQAAARVQETGSDEAELWFYALVVRALSFEVEQDFEGPTKRLLRTASA